MPIYEYECEQCRHCFEKLVFAGDDVVADCPQCGSHEVKKLISCTRVISEGLASACDAGSSGKFS
ncbi:MAG: zinc ribbon domain-containing protein [Desulfobacteraceae bacterium]|jgi:putative FmdB family regulatory protein